MTLVQPDLLPKRTLPDLLKERTIAPGNYYRSSLYTVDLTPEYIANVKPNKWPKRGQTPWPTNWWSPYDAWYQTNHWIHRVNDREQFALYWGFRGGIHSVTVEDQPSHEDYMSRRRHYEDDIFGQTLGGMAVGIQLGTLFGFLHTFNQASEANIFQSLSMPPNRWLPMHKATLRFRARIMINCQMQCASFIGAYAFCDGVVSQFRGQDDLWNPHWGGLGAGIMLWTWFKNPHTTIPLGVLFGMWMAYFRYGLLPENTKKLALDFNRPLWGIFGGIPMWIAQWEPEPDMLAYQWWDSKYRC